MAGSQNSTNDVDVDLGRLFASLARNWARILFWALVVTAIAFVLAWLATPKYRGEARLLIETRESVFTQPETRNQPSENPVLDEEGVTSQVEIIASSDILRAVAARDDLLAGQTTKLSTLPEFDEAADLSMVDRLMIAIGMKTDPTEMPAEERVLMSMREKLQVYRIEKSRVIVVEFSSENAQLAASIPNAIAEEYIALNKRAKLESNSDATGWLAPEIKDLTQRVKDAEARVADFRAQSDLLIGQNQSVLATQQLSELSTELSRVRANRATTEATAESVRTALRQGASLDALPKVLESPLIQRLREREVQLKADIADLSTTLLGNHPRIRALNSQLADLEQQIRSEAQNVLTSMTTEAETARARETQLTADLNRMKAESARAGEDEVELRALEREAASQRQLLESYLARYREASSRTDRGYLPADARLFQRASVPPEPYFPKILPIVIAAFAGSILVMSLITLLRELASGRAMRPANAQMSDPITLAPQPTAAANDAKTGLSPNLGAKSNKTAELNRQMSAGSDNARIAVDQLPRTSVQAARVVVGEIDIERAAEKLISTGATRAIFVSPEGDEGAAASVLIAREVADSGLRVLLLDLSESGAASSTMLESSYFSGVTNLLASEAQFSDVIHSDRYSECHVIPIGTADAAKSMRAAERLPLILDSLATVYDLVVIECGPASATAIARLNAEGAVVMMSVIDPTDPTVSESAAELRKAGHADLLLVSPAGRQTPTSPAPGRTAA